MILCSQTCINWLGADHLNRYEHDVDIAPQLSKGIFVKHNWHYITKFNLLIELLYSVFYWHLSPVIVVRLGDLLFATFGRSISKITIFLNWGYLHRVLGNLKFDFQGTSGMSCFVMVLLHIQQMIWIKIWLLILMYINFLLLLSCNKLLFLSITLLLIVFLLELGKCWVEWLAN